MDAKKEARHFVRDRCNFNKKKRIKYITIGLVISVLTGFLLYNIAFADTTNYHHTGAAKINVAGSEMQLRFEYVGTNDKLKTDGEYRSLFKSVSRSVYVWADKASSGDLQVGIERDGGGHVTKENRIICKTSIDDGGTYGVVTFNISYIQPAHKYISKYQRADGNWIANGACQNQSGGRFTVFSTGQPGNTTSEHLTYDHWVTLKVQINLSNTGMLTPKRKNYFTYATRYVDLIQATHHIVYHNGTSTWWSRNYTDGDWVDDMDEPDKEGWTFNGWTLNGSITNGFTICQDTDLYASWTPNVNIAYFDMRGGKMPNNDNKDINGCKIIDDGLYYIQSGLNTNRYIHVRNASSERQQNAIVTYTSNGGAQARWVFERYKNTQYYYIISQLNGLSLNLDSTPSNDQTNEEIELWDQDKGVADHLWYLKDVGNGKVAIYNKSTNRCLDIENGVDGDTVNISQWIPAPESKKWQQWALVPADTTQTPPKRKCATYPVYLPSNEPVLDMAEFAGWSADPNATEGDLFPEDDIGDIEGPTTFYAVWKYKSLAKFDGNGGTCVAEDQTVYTGEDFTLPSTDEVSRSNFRLIGWATEKHARKELLEPGSTITAEKKQGTVTYYAIWQNTNGNCNLDSVITDSNMFRDSEKLEGSQGTKYSSPNVDSKYAHPDGGADDPGYYTEK